MALHTERFGAGQPLVLVHGFTQNGRCWGPFGEMLGTHDVVRVDAPGHGRSGHADADLVEGARLLADTCGRATYLGYSMGGRLCLHLAMARPDLVERLVLIGATAGIEDEADRAARVDADELLAARLEADGIESFLERWLALPLFAGIPPDRNHLEQRLTNTAAGLAASLRNAGTGVQRSLWDRLHGLEMPVLLLAGERDQKFRELAGRMQRAIGVNATVAIVGDAGHAVHLERPEETADAVTSWLAG